MATKITKVTEFNKIIPPDEEALQAKLEARATPGKFIEKPAFDEIDTSLMYNDNTVGVGAAAISAIVQNPTNIALGTVLDQIKADPELLNLNDPLLNENTSTYPVKEASVLFNEAQHAKFQQRGMKQAALSSPRALNISETPSERRKQLADELKQAMTDMPIPDVTTYAEGRKVTIPSEVIAQANTVGKTKACLILEKILGKAGAAEVVLCSQMANFFHKPHLWLGQRLFFEMSKRGMWDRISPDPEYASPLAEKDKQVVAQGIATLFSWQVADQLSVISRVRGIELDHAFKLVVEEVCRQQRQEKKPLDYNQEYDDTASLEQLVGAA